MSEDTIKNVTDAEERARKRLERNLRLAEEPDAVVIIPFSKPKRFAMAHMVRHLDRLSANVRRRIGFGIEFEEARSMMEEIGKFTDRLWSEMITLAPNLHSLRKEEWRKVNDLVDVRRKLAHRKIALVLAPRSEETGQAAIAVKVIENQNFLLRQTTGSFEDLKDITERYQRLATDFDDFLCSLSEKIGMEYRPQFRNFEEHTATSEKETAGKAGRKTAGQS